MYLTIMICNATSRRYQYVLCQVRLELSISHTRSSSLLPNQPPDRLVISPKYDIIGRQLIGLRVKWHSSVISGGLGNGPDVHLALIVILSLSTQQQQLIITDTIICSLMKISQIFFPISLLISVIVKREQLYRYKYSIQIANNINERLLQNCCSSQYDK